MLQPDVNLLRAVAPGESGKRAALQALIMNAAGKDLASTLATYEINTSLRIAHFLAQTCYESEGFCATEEEASGRAYEGRLDLGNTQPGDGVRYKGRGLIQITGRANYAAAQTRLGIPLVDHPELAAAPENSLLIACDYWKSRGINKYCDADDIQGVTRKVNGGLNGLTGREEYLTRAKRAVAALKQTAPIEATKPTLRKNDKGPDVVRLQQALLAKGYITWNPDADFGPMTEAAVKKFQADAGLIADGIVGQGTWTALG